MAQTEVEICNFALARLGAKALIYSLNDGTAEGNMCAQIYPHARDLTLASFPWPFATKRATLTVVPGDTRTAWTYVYALPTDCVTARFVHPGIRVVPYNARIPFVLESGANGTGRVLLTDEEDAELVYTARVTDVASFPVAFVDALAWLIARDLAMPLGTNPQMMVACGQQFVAAIGNAGSIEFRQSQEDPPQQVEGEYIRARGSTLSSNSQS